MNMKFLIALFLILSFFNIPPEAFAADEGLISGKVVNKTSGGSSVSRVKVTLKGFRGNSSLPAATTGTNDKGDFEFKGLATDKEYLYKVSANYQGVDYESEAIGFKGGEKTKEVEVAVYDTTKDSKEIKINLSHMVVYPGKGSLQAQEFYALSNTGDRSYTGSRLISSVNQMETFRTRIPDGARSLEYLTGLMECCVALEDGSLIDTMSINPGVKEIAFGYNFPYKSKEYTINKTFDYPVETFNFVIEDKDIQVAGGGLTSQGRVNIEGKNFLVFNRKNIGAGETLRINVSGLPSAPLMGFLKWWALAFILAAVAAVISYPRLRKRRALQAVSVPSSEREKLIKQIARLDDDYEEGKIPEGTYKRLRSQKKARLMELSGNKGKRGT